MKTLVSVIIPVRDGEKYIEAAIESILNQTYNNLEIIVLDDGSKDSTLSLLNKYSKQIKIHALAAQGVWSVRNHAANIATADYLVFQDADDIASKDRIEVQMKMLENDSTLDLIFGHMIEFSGDHKPSSMKDSAQEKIASTTPGVMLIKKQAFFKVGEFSNDWKVASFMDWYMRAIDLGLKIAVSPEVILARRVHQSNSTLKDGAMLPSEYLDVIRKGLARRKE
jgi:glycosyltransferase involved in cell wall biosynthesis